MVGTTAQVIEAEFVVHHLTEALEVIGGGREGLQGGVLAIHVEHGVEARGPVVVEERGGGSGVGG